VARKRILWKFLRFAVLATLLAAAGFTLYLDFRVRSEFEGRRFALPARIYARPLELHAGCGCRRPMSRRS
jgi:penicillin-binding protein 1B